MGPGKVPDWTQCNWRQQLDNQQFKVLNHQFEILLTRPPNWDRYTFSILFIVQLPDVTLFQPHSESVSVGSEWNGARKRNKEREKGWWWWGGEWMVYILGVFRKINAAMTSINLPTFDLVIHNIMMLGKFYVISVIKFSLPFDHSCTNSGSSLTDKGWG